MLSADLLEDWTVQFSFDEERLIFTDEFDLEGTAYVRAELSSAVVGTSWGDVKAMLR